LVVELGIRVLDGNDGDKTFEQIFSGYRRILLLQQIVLFSILIHRASQGGAEAGQMRAPVRIVNGVGVRHQLGVVAVVVLQDDIHGDVRFSGGAVLGVLVGAA